MGQWLEGDEKMLAVIADLVGSDLPEGSDR
jgi:hypothetical protein